MNKNCTQRKERPIGLLCIEGDSLITVSVKCYIAFRLE